MWRFPTFVPKTKPLTPQISVLLPVYNEPLSWIACAIDSMLHQIFQSMELIVIQDEPFREDIEPLIRQYEQQNYHIRFIINSSNMGLAQTLNEGAGYARGKYIARMDADDISFPHRLMRQFQFMEQNPDMGLSGCQVVKIDENGSIVGHSNSPLECGLLYKMARFVNVVTHPTIIMRKTLFEKLSGYRNLPGGEDYDLLLRIIDLGIPIANLPDLLLQYRVRSTGETVARSCTQKLCFKYVQRLYLERRQTGFDRFDASDIRAQIARAQIKYGRRQDKAQAGLVSARQAQAAGNPVGASLHLISSFCVSPIQRAYYWDWFRAEAIRKWYGIRLSNPG